MGFLSDNLIAPMRDGTGYNVFTTILIAAFLVAAVLLLMRTGYLKRRKTLEIFSDALPFVLFGSAVRSLEDGCFLPCQWPLKLLLITPGLWILIFLIFLGLERFIGRKVSLVGWILAAPALVFALARSSNFWGLALVLGFSLISSALVLGPVTKFLRLEISPAGRLILLAHIFDGSSTFVAVRFFGYLEEHVLARFLISIGSPSLFYLVKIIGILALVLASERIRFSGTERKALQAALFIVGLGPALRNTFSLLIGV
ncbi:MAG: DUF63 family protein [archaeon]